MIGDIDKNIMKFGNFIPETYQTFSFSKITKITFQIWRQLKMNSTDCSAPWDLFMPRTEITFRRNLTDKTGRHPLIFLSLSENLEHLAHPNLCLFIIIHSLFNNPSIKSVSHIVIHMVYRCM